MTSIENKSSDSKASFHTCNEDKETGPIEKVNLHQRYKTQVMNPQESSDEEYVVQKFDPQSIAKQKIVDHFNKIKENES